MSPQEELTACIADLENFSAAARVLLEHKRYQELNTVLYKMERVAREGTYVIFDIADLVG